jgi:hypothetical protein
MTEVYRDVVDYESLYEISNQGNIRSLNFGGKKGIIKNLTLTLDKKGYYYVSLTKNGKSSIQRIHKLVAMAFLEHIPNGYKAVIDHINSNPSDNRVENLRIVTNRFNVSKDKSNETNRTGVSLNKRSGKYYVQILKGYKCFSLGTYIDLEYASNLYQQAVNHIDNVSTKEELFDLLGLTIRKNYSNYPGVSYNKRDKKWIAYVKVNGKRKLLGNHVTEQDATNAVNLFNTDEKDKDGCLILKRI